MVHIATDWRNRLFYICEEHDGVQYEVYVLWSTGVE